MICPSCEMYYPEGDWTCWGCSLGEACEGGKCGMPITHECPDPLDLDIAKLILESSMAVGHPVHPRTRARCVLAYKAAGLR